MSNNINHEIKTIVAELQSMSPRTQLEIVRLCKRVAELTPDYIEDVTEEITDNQYAAFTATLNQAKTELQSQITTNANDIDALEVRTGDAEDDIEALQTRMSTAETNIQTNANAIDAEETARQDLIYVNSAGDTRIKSAPNKSVGIEGHTSVFLTSNDVIVNMTNNGFILSVNLNGNPHELKFDNNGELLIDGNAFGGGKLFKYILYLRNESISLDFKIAFYHTKDVSTNDLDTTALSNGALTDLFGLNSNQGFTYDQFFGWGDNGKMIINEIIAVKSNNKITGFRLGFYNLDTNSIDEYAFAFDSSAGKIPLSE